jgi:hypothetical protein
MIEYPTWRSLFYKLAEEYPDCLMLNFTVKVTEFLVFIKLFFCMISIPQLISDAGHQGEITSVSTACHQIEVFSRVLRTSISSLLEGDKESLEKNLPEFTVSTLVLLFCSLSIVLSLLENGMPRRTHISLHSVIDAYFGLGTKRRS